jgi:hypothetical protein
MTTLQIVAASTFIVLASGWAVIASLERILGRSIPRLRYSPAVVLRGSYSACYRDGNLVRWSTFAKH